VRIPFLPPKWAQDDLWTKARKVPSLDLRFADNKSLVDATTGSNLVTFTRASSGTFVGSDGVIKTAVTNLLLRSEEFNDAYWVKTRASVTANAASAPTGNVTADKLVEDNTASATHRIDSGTISVASGATTFSLYAKAAERDRLTISFDGSPGGVASSASCVFNLSTGVASSPAVSNNISSATASIVNAGDGWYRVILTASASAAFTMTCRINLMDATSTSYTGDGTSGLFLWGAQLEQSSTVGEYIPTTSTINSAPRFDHNPTTGESLGLLVEEQRTNLFTKSEEFDDAALAKSNVTITADATAAPTGATTADKMLETTFNGVHEIRSTSVSLTSGVTYSVSLFAKEAEKRYLRIGFSGAWGTSNNYAIFDLQDGSNTYKGNASLIASSQAFPGGWYRLILTWTVVTTATNTLFFGINNDSTTGTSYTGVATDGLFLWGAQLEAGAFPTSYIPTTAATVTRSADVASISGSNFSSWFNQSEGSLFVGFALNGIASQNYVAAIDAGSGFADSHTIYNVSGVLRYDVFVSSSTQSALTPAPGTALTVGSLSTFAGSYAVNNFAASRNGGSVSTDTSGSLPVTSRLVIGSNGSTFQTNGTLKRLVYWPRRLGNEVLQGITQ